MMKNRITHIRHIDHDEEREKATRQLLDGIMRGFEKDLSPEELVELQVAMASENNPRVLRFFWDIACRSPYHKVIEDYAQNILKNKEKIYRHYAFIYVAMSNPLLVPVLIETYRKDPDPAVLYQVAQQIREKDPHAGVDMIIDIYPKANSHELYDALNIELYENGDAEHLAKIQSLMKQDPKMEKLYRYIAESLEKKLRQ